MKGPVRVSLEASGSYHFDLAVTLSDASKVELMVVNPTRGQAFR